jgi:hypothetical protein
MKYKIIFCAAVATLFTSARASDVAQLPDPSTIPIPDVTPSTDPKVKEEGYKFYYFHNSNVSFSEAHQDFVECRGYLIVGGGTQVPGFIPWGEEHRRIVYKRTPMFPGIATEVLAAIILPKLQRGAESNKMRRCMGTRGYERYAIAEKTWDALNEGEEPQMILIQAKLASGPKPQDEIVTR